MGSDPYLLTVHEAIAQGFGLPPYRGRVMPMLAITTRAVCVAGTARRAAGEHLARGPKGALLR